MTIRVLEHPRGPTLWPLGPRSPGLFFRLSSRCLAKGNRIHRWTNLVGPLLVHNLFSPRSHPLLPLLILPSPPPAPLPFCQGAKLTHAQELEKRRRYEENIRWAKEQRENAVAPEKSAFEKTLERQYSELEEMNKSWKSYREEVAPLVTPRKPHNAVGESPRLQALVQPLNQTQSQGYQGWN